MRILVTGATGFLGSAFTRHALAGGHQVGGLINPAKSPPADLAEANGLSWLRGSLADPPTDAIKQFKPEICVHFAWVATPGIYLQSPENRDYFEWSRGFLRLSREAGVRHVIGIGTCIEYAPSNRPLSEYESAVSPATPYARYKNELRLALEQDAREQPYELCWGRVFYPYGAGEHPARLCSSLIARLSRGEKLVLKTPDSTKDYIHANDVASGVLALVNQRATGIFNLGTGTGIAIRDLARMLAEMLGYPELVDEVNPPEVDPLGYVVADASRLRALGWQPRQDLRAGLAELMAALTPAPR